MPMGTVGKERRRVSARGSVAVRTHPRSTLLGGCLPEFLVLDFFLCPPVRHHVALARGAGSFNQHLLVHISNRADALDTRVCWCFHCVLGSHSASPCRVCLRAARSFLRRGMSRPLFQRTLFRSDDASGCPFDRGCR